MAKVKINTEWFESMRPLDPRSQGKVFMAVLDYLVGNEVAELDGIDLVVFSGIKDQIDHVRSVSEKRKVSGARGGNPRLVNQKQDLVKQKPILDKQNENLVNQNQILDKQNQDLVNQNEEACADIFSSNNIIISSNNISSSSNRPDNNKSGPIYGEESWIKDLLNVGVTEAHARDWLKVRKGKHLVCTKTAMKDTLREFSKIPDESPDTLIAFAIVKGWGGFKAQWYINNKQKQNVNTNQPNYFGCSSDTREREYISTIPD